MVDGRFHDDESLARARSLAELVDTLPGMLYCCRCDPARTMEFVSEGSVALTGYQPVALTRGAVVYTDLIDPADSARVRHEIQTALHFGERFKVSYTIHTANGDKKRVREQGCGIAGSDGQILAIKGFITDLSTAETAYRGLERRTVQPARELGMLLEIARNLAATLELEPLLGLILDEVRAAVEYQGAGILTLEDEVLAQVAQRGPALDGVSADLRLPLAEAGIIQNLVMGTEPLVITDVWAESPPARAYRQVTAEEWLRARPYIRSWVGVPLRVRERPLGLLVITYGEANHFSDHDVRLLEAVAAQAAVAIDNARLMASARETAALEERQRLARELHDAVTQTLFSASLIGDVLPTLWARDPQRGEQALQDLQVLTRGALAEMRALLFELRPNALTEVPLDDLLRHLGEAMTGRSRIPVEITIQAALSLPADVQVALYRIAQEALNNVAKYAEATRVALRLRQDPDGTLELSVSDDGRGFDIAHSPGGHFGLRTMRERASLIGARLTVTSAPGRGTGIVVRWPAPQ